jgi:hypothetical protein
MFNAYAESEPTNKSLQCIAAIAVAIAICLVIFGTGRSNANNGTDRNSEHTEKETVEQRTLTFPKGPPVGHILVIEKKGKVLQTIAAAGTISLLVSSSSRIVFEFNNRIFENPALLNQVSPSGIDALRVSYISMDENEAGRCDRALQYVPLFAKQLRRLSVDKSDATDHGLLSTKKLPELHRLDCSCSEIRGTCFKDFPRMYPTLKALSAASCPLNPDCIASLTKIPLLAELTLSGVLRGGIGPDQVKLISSCKNLELLMLNDNKKVDDRCMEYLLRLKHLENLDVRNTSVTVDGLKKLAPLKLKLTRLTTSVHAGPELQRLLPNTKIVVKDGHLVDTLDPETKRFFAPLH